MLYYYAEKSRLCLVRHSTIIFYKPSFVKHHLKYLAILPRFASRSAAFLYILFPARLFFDCRTDISGRKSATPHSYPLTIFQIRPRSGHRISSLLTPISSLYFKSVRGADTTISHFSFLISNFQKLLPPTSSLLLPPYRVRRGKMQNPPKA